MSGALKIAFKIVLEYWWVIAPVALFFTFREIWLKYVQTKFIDSIKWVLLEIKIPQEVKKTPKAMEQVFAALHGIKHGANFVDKWFNGKFQEWFSLEIISQGGQIHFFIRVLESFKNLAEAQFYAQYPDAEINQVEDYIDTLPSNIPGKDYDIWGTELVLTQKDAYPIKTYSYFFEESKEEERIDPLASLFEVLGSLTPEENIWVQVLARPADDKWRKEGEKLVEKLTGKKVEITKKGIILEEAHGWFDVTKESLHELFFGSLSKETIKKPEEKSLKSLIAHLSPGQKEVVSSIEKNIAKLGFETVIRFVYWAKSDIFSKVNVAAIIGSFKQFNTLNLNGFKPNKKISPSIDYWLKKRREFYRKVNVLNNYKKRYFPHGNFSKRGFVFNIEELATIYHFPGSFVKAPALSRVEAKKSGPPSSLPTE